MQPCQALFLRCPTTITRLQLVCGAVPNAIFFKFKLSAFAVMPQEDSLQDTLLKGCRNHDPHWCLITDKVSHAIAFPQGLCLPLGITLLKAAHLFLV